MGSGLCGCLCKNVISWKDLRELDLDFSSFLGRQRKMNANGNINPTSQQGVFDLDVRDRFQFNRGNH